MILRNSGQYENLGGLENVRSEWKLNWQAVLHKFHTSDMHISLIN
jgi:hypothetical protein